METIKYCNRCGIKIGFWQRAHSSTSTDKNGNSVTYCFGCSKKNKEEVEREKERQRKRHEEERKMKIRDFLVRYFSECSTEKIAAIGYVFSEKEIFEKFEDNSIEKVRQHFINLYPKIEELIESGNYEHMSFKKTCEIILDFLNDIEKIFKLFNRKEINTDYFELIGLFNELVKERGIKESEEVVKREYKRISNKLKNDINVRSVVKEFIIFPLNFNPDIDIEDLKLTLKRFSLEFKENELPELIEELKEEIDLENFEDNLGKNNKRFSLPEYDSLSGYQFELFSKKIFEALDYVVVQTKLSNDQGADLIVMKDGKKTAVQIKKYSGKVSNKAIQEVVAAKKYYKCENAMVVTTGEFTKSAIQLAISNEVEIWDNNKLKEIIRQINNSSKTNLKSSQYITFTEDSFPLSCPYCSSVFNVSTNDAPPLNEPGKIKCPECGVNLSIQIPKEFYVCIGCKREFEIVKERIKHSKKCKKVMERKFNCRYCKERFTLDDSEMEALNRERSLKVECPFCNKSNAIKK